MKKEKREMSTLEMVKYVIPVVVAVLIFLVIKVQFLNKDYEIEALDTNSYAALVSGKNQSLIYFTSGDCATCDEVTKMFEKVLKGSKIKLYMINVDNISDEEKEDSMNLLDITKTGFSAPLLILVANNEVISSLDSPIDEDRFISYLQENNLVD